MAGDTAWILGDQLHRGIASLRDAEPGRTRLLFVESTAKIGGKRWHRQRLHLVLAAMRRFAAACAAEGFTVDYRKAASFPEGLAAHRLAHRPASVRVMEPMSQPGLAMLRRLDVSIVRSNQFLCHADEFAEWARGVRQLRMDAFYRWQRRRLGYLMDGDQPLGGRWSFDKENRQPPPREPVAWPSPSQEALDDLDRAVVADLPASAFGAAPDGTWATTTAGARRHLDEFVRDRLPRFGPHQDAMTTRSWHLAHAVISPYLNLGLLHPREVCDAADAAWRAGRVPLASAEGFIRQVIGWREYVWGVYTLRATALRSANALEAHAPLPAAFTDPARTRMRCLADSLEGVAARGWAHHIQRLMVLGNLTLLLGTTPQRVVEWMWASFVDGAEWVMLPNAAGMALYADGGGVVTKPYAGGGAYIDRMSDYCAGCPYDPRRRTGPDACPFTVLYWDFLARHRTRLAKNPRMRIPIAGLARRDDLDEIRRIAAGLRRGLADGTV